MPLITEEAIVLARYPFREKSAVVVFLCQERGVIRAVVRQSRGKGGGAALEPLARVKVTLFCSPRRELAIVNEVVLEHSVLDLAARPQAWVAALVAAELVLELCPPGTSQETFFRLLQKTVVWLEAGVAPHLAVPYVMAWSLKLAGVLPQPTECAVCGQSLLDLGAWWVQGLGFCCRQHGTGGVSLRPHSYRFLVEALRKPLDALAFSPGPELLSVLQKLVEHFLEKPLRSLHVFRALMTQEGSSC